MSTKKGISEISLIKKNAFRENIYSLWIWLVTILQNWFNFFHEQYETEEYAMEARKALHGKKWPSSNPKILQVDYATTDEVSQCEIISWHNPFSKMCQTTAVTENRNFFHWPLLVYFTS